MTALMVGILALLTAAVLPPTAAQAADETLSHVGSTSTAGNRTSHVVRVPGEVQPGDALVLVITTNSTKTVTGPTGWTLLESRNGNGVSGRAWTRTASGADAGAAVTVRTGGRTKSVLSVAAYRSSGMLAEITASAMGGSNTASSSHTTPQVPVAEPGSWLVSTWAEKSSVTQSWSLPPGATERTEAAAPGSGKVSQVLADSGATVPVGTAPGRTATTSARAARSVMLSVVVAPRGAGSNTEPTASFTSACIQLACEFDASASTDVDGDPLTHRWDFGDGNTGTGVEASHEYATRGARTVTLTVSDGRSSATATRSITVFEGGPGRQPVPGHTTLVPETANSSMPRIDAGEIWDIEVVGDRAFVAGGFSSLANRTTNNTNTVNQAYLASFDLVTGLVDTTFRPTFGGGGVDAVEASPDGTKLYVAGSFNTVNGVTKRKVASLDPSTGSPVEGFTANANSVANALAVTNSTVYVGGRFSSINGQQMVGLAALDGATGALDREFDNQLSGGVGTNGVLTVQQLKLTHDSATLLVVHTARRIDGENRYGVGLVDTASKQLLPWRTRLWEDNLQYVGGIQRIYAGDVAPDDSYFVVTSGSGGDRPPINDTAVAFSFDGADNREPLWVSRAFDSIYSVAITERAVYIGGHFQWNESPTAPDPWPGLDDVGYGTGQGLSGYALGDAVVRRDHLGALNPVDGKALEWHPGSNSIEGNKAMVATGHGLLTGGDARRQGGANVGRVAFFDLDQLPAPSNPDTTITTPIAGRVVATGTQFVVEGAATTSGTLARVQVEIQQGSRYLQDDLTTWGSFNTVNAPLGASTGGGTPWSLPLTLASSGDLTIRARAVNTSGAQDPVKALKKIEAFSFDDLPPSTRITDPRSSLQPSTSFVLRGSATDDKGVGSVTIYLKDIGSGRYLTADGTMADDYTTIRVEPDVPNAISTTWQYEVNLPHEGSWKVGALARDTIGQSDTRWDTRDYTVDSSGLPPVVTIAQPVSVVPPTTSPTLAMTPGGRLTFSGNASDDRSLATVEVLLRNTTTRENLAADGSWGSDVAAGWFKVSPANMDQASYDWSFTTPEELVPGTYDFRVRATDKQELTTSSSMQGRVVVGVSVPGDAAPDGLLDLIGTQTASAPHLDLTGTAVDDQGVSNVRVAILETDTDRYLRTDGSLGAGFGVLEATLGTPGAPSTPWSLSVDLPSDGSYAVTAYAVDGSNQVDPSTSGATATYRYYPGDAPPSLVPELTSPTDGTLFTEARIFVSGRAVDDVAMSEVQIAVLDSQGQFMGRDGAFGATERWNSAFLNSPGSPGSNYSYTTPIIPDGDYVVRVRPVDNHDQYADYRQVSVGVTAPAGNQPPVAVASASCVQNGCTFDARGSTDENPSTLTYSWNYGNGRTGSGALASFTYSAAGTFTPTLTVRDEYGLTSTVALDPLVITEPEDNRPPTSVITPPTCVGLVCNISGATSADDDTGDTITYLWDFGDGTTSASTSPSHAFPAAGSYTVTLTVTDGWGRSQTTSRSVTVSP